MNKTFIKGFVPLLLFLSLISISFSQYPAFHYQPPEYIRILPNGDVVIYYAQVGVSEDSTQIQKWVNQATSLGFTTYRIFTSDSQQKVEVGPYYGYSECKTATVYLHRGGFTDAFVIETSLSASEAISARITIAPSLYTQAYLNATTVSSLSEEELFNRGMKFYSTSSTNITVRSLVELIKRFPKSSKVPTAKYYLGTVYYGRYWSRSQSKAPLQDQWEHLRAAAELFSDIVNNYSQDTVYSAAKFQLGLCYRQYTKFGTNSKNKLLQAAELFKSLADERPNTPYASTAQLQRAASYLEAARSAKRAKIPPRFDLVREECKKVSLLSGADAKTKAIADLMYAESYYYEGNYNFAISACSSLLWNCSTTQHPECLREVATAEYWIAESEFLLRKYPQAEKQFKLFQDKYLSMDTILFPGFMSRAIFCRAQIFERFVPDTTSMNQVIEQLITKYPDSPEAWAAQTQILGRNPNAKD